VEGAIPMSEPAGSTRIELEPGATVAIIGGGPAGAFFAIHLLRESQQLGRGLKVSIFERRLASDLGARAGAACDWKGCNYCAGGISPRLNEVLRALDLRLPSEVIQSRIEAITIQGFWKNIELEVPPGREILCVYRGSRPLKRADRHYSLDAFLLAEAVKAGAALMAGEVNEVRYASGGKPLVRFRAGGAENWLEADLAVFAAGINESVGPTEAGGPMLRSLKSLIPGFVPPRSRRAMILELEPAAVFERARGPERPESRLEGPGVAPGSAPSGENRDRARIPAALAGTIHFVEYGSRAVPLEMCALVPKRGFITAVLVGKSVDRASDCEKTRDLTARFLDLPHIRKLLPPGSYLTPACACSPNMVVGNAKRPFGRRVAAVGDLATARLYKDGILSAQETAHALAHTVLAEGIDPASLRRGYGPVLKRFQRDNRFAWVVFLLHRLFFGSSVLSRVLYQAVITERKTTPRARRRLEQILWRIASGEDAYEEIFLSMIHPATVWLILTGGVLVTFRNYLTELCFGLRWEGFGRFTTGVPLERLEAKRREFARLIVNSSVVLPERLEFERMYTIKIHAPRHRILEQLGRFGEPDRGYLRPRWVRIRRTEGKPNAPGCVIRYEALARRLAFHLELEQVAAGHLAVYRVRDGFAKGGALVFEIEELDREVCGLSIYVAFNFTRGRTWAARGFWRLFRLLFPAYVHDVLWNHSLCQMKDLVETRDAAGELAAGQPCGGARCPSEGAGAAGP